MLIILIITTFLLTMGILRLHIKSKFGKYKGNNRLDGKTIVVTGADSGIGFFCAKDFASRGGKVIMLSCDLKVGEKAKEMIICESGNKNVKVKYVDFSNLETIRRCAHDILSEEPYIHILLNNAGAVKVGLYQTIDNLDATTQINYFGPFLLTNLLLERLKKSSPSRIVNVTSISQKYGELDLSNFGTIYTNNEWLLYSNSKLAITCFTSELARSLKGLGVTANCLHPGVFFSGIVRTLPLFSQFLWEKVTRIFLKTIEEGAQTSIYLCVSPDVEHINGRYFEDCQISTLPAIAQDVETCKNLWNLSEIAVGLKIENSDLNIYK